MSANYTTVQWTKPKRVYDLWMIAGVAAYLITFIVVSSIGREPTEQFSAMVLLIRAFGSCAIIMLHVILVIGPLARLMPAAAPLLYNRRHLGVLTAIIALVHAALVMLFYHGFGVLNPLVSLLVTNTEYQSLSAFPFQILGALALVILLMLAATSHDFWQKTLGRDQWKCLHMLVYVAYALVILHVALGALQSEKALVYYIMTVASVVVVGGLHRLAAAREAQEDALRAASDVDGWIEVAGASDIKMNRAKIICPPEGEKIAIFRHEKGFSAVTNLCAHQGGPLGEGQVIDGCITCPWHGWQYKPGDGQSPPPFKERIATYRVKVENSKLYVASTPEPPGTAVEPVSL